MGGKGSGSNRKERRLDRILQLEAITKLNMNWGKERVIAEFMLETGVTRRTALEYLNLLIRTNRILPW